MTPTKLSERVFRSKHAVTRIVDKLEKLGFVKRGNIVTDRRVRKVSITNEGLSFIKEAQAVGQQRLSHILLHPLEQKQLETLRKTMKQMREHALELVAKHKVVEVIERPEER
jgi:DNA-binding MarR family transcriptional regulator